MFEFFKKKQDSEPKPKYATKEEEMLARCKQELEELENSSYLKTLYLVDRDKNTGEILELNESPAKRLFNFLFDYEITDNFNYKKLNTRDFLALDAKRTVTNHESGWTRKTFGSVGKLGGICFDNLHPVIHILYDDNAKKYYFEMTDSLTVEYAREYEYRSDAYDDIASLQKAVMMLNDIIRLEHKIKELEVIVAKQQLEAKAWTRN